MRVRRAEVKAEGPVPTLLQERSGLFEIRIATGKCVVESMLERTGCREVPLAGGRILVAEVLQASGERPDCGTQGVPLGLVALHQARDARHMGVQSGHRRPAAWTAQGRGRKAVGEPNAFGRHAVEVRRPDERMAVTAQIVPAMVVRHDHQKIRRPVLTAQGYRGDAREQAAARDLRKSAANRRRGGSDLAFRRAIRHRKPTSLQFRDAVRRDARNAPRAAVSRDPQPLAETTQPLGASAW